MQALLPALPQWARTRGSHALSRDSTPHQSSAPPPVPLRLLILLRRGRGGGRPRRENPRKSFRLVDPEFSASFAAAADGCGGGGGSSSVVQDRESETESYLPPPLRSLSKRPRRSPETAAGAEAEPLSSISDVSSEEDVARCQMLLSRDAWARSVAGEEEEDQQSGGCDEAGAKDEDGEDGDEGNRGSAPSRCSGGGAGTSAARARSSSDRTRPSGATGRATRRWPAVGAFRPPAARSAEKSSPRPMPTGIRASTAAPPAPGPSAPPRPSAATSDPTSPHPPPPPLPIPLLSLHLLFLPTAAAPTSAARASLISTNQLHWRGHRSPVIAPSPLPSSHTKVPTQI